MFKSATIRLTFWYLVLLMVLSLLFSGIIFQLMNTEIGFRLERFQTSIQVQQEHNQDAEDAENNPNTQKTTTTTVVRSPAGNIDIIRTDEQQNASNRLFSRLVWLNLFILVVGSFLSYFLARRHLQPIKKAHEAQSRFTSDASHELRTPLAAMKTETEVALKDKNATNEELRTTLQSNLEEVDKLTKLSEMLLSLSRLDNKDLDFETINLTQITNEVIKSFKQPKSRLTIKKSFHNVNIDGNKIAIFDLIKILIDNAILYSDKNSQIIINITKEKQNARFDITNQGNGIAEDKIPHIFERFYQSDDSRTNGDKKGFGLGLSLAQKITDLHHGAISVISVPDKTTTFTFTLPLVK